MYTPFCIYLAIKEDNNMAIKPRLYLETSVWNFVFADDAPEKKHITLTFFDKVKEDEYEIFISDTVIQEIERADESKKRLLLEIIKEYKLAPTPGALLRL
jgi:hypothetical protein